jgi:hypothetical protein
MTANAGNAESERDQFQKRTDYPPLHRALELDQRPLASCTRARTGTTIPAAFLGNKRQAENHSSNKKDDWVKTIVHIVVAKPSSESPERSFGHQNNPDTLKPVPCRHRSQILTWTVFMVGQDFRENRYQSTKSKAPRTGSL